MLMSLAMNGDVVVVVKVGYKHVSGIHIVLTFPWMKWATLLKMCL
jgi:hypothetical protein